MSSYKEKKLVPRFRRRNENLIDADDQEAQALIDKDLQSHFTWTSDLKEDLKYQFDNFDHQENSNQQISISDQTNELLSYDIENNNNQEFWKNIIQDNETIKWNDDQQEQQQITFSIEDKLNEQQWSLNDQQSIQLDSNQHLNKQNFDTIHQNEQQIFIQGESFRDQIKFAIGSSNDQLNIFPNDSEDHQTISIDSNLPSINSILSLPQAPIILHWLEGISQYTLSLPVQQSLQQYSPLNSTTIQIDSETLKSLKWSIELLKENLLRSYLISLPNHFQPEQFSLPEEFHLNLSINDENNQQLFSLIDLTFKQTISLSSNDIKEQLLSIIDLIHIKQNFGNDERMIFVQWSLQELKSVVQNISPIEFFHLLYSPFDAKPIELEQLLIESDEGSARAFRRYRCKHMSIKNDQTDQLDSQQTFNLQFNGNEPIAIGEQQIQNDLDQQDLIPDQTLSLEEDLRQIYDITVNESSPVNLGPCLYRSDYECDPPKTWSRYRREIGYISYDASLEHPIYYLDKSYKRFVHIPKDREKCSYNIFQGYSEFIEKIRLNPQNYFRPYDSTDLRHLLYWYTQKQYLFSSTNSNLLKPPTFICRRTVLRTILANLYYDSEPWKLLVLRIKGQFYLSIANKASKKAEDMTEDEYSGYHFEQLFTTKQPNTTRFKENIPLENPQQGFHTVRYWQFGKFNILYSNEIDGELMVNTPPTSDDTTKQPTTENTESNSMETEEDIEDESKLAQINENLQITTNDEDEKVEKKKRNEYELKSGYVEMKCTNKKFFYRDENKLHTLHWWAQMWLANVDTLMIGYKTSNDGLIEQIDLFSIEQFISKFYSRYNLYLKYCFSYLYSFLQLIQNTVHIDDSNTIHVFTYIPQPLEIDPVTGKPLQMDLPKSVPFRYTQIKRSNQRHANFMPQNYLNYIQRTIPNEQDKQIKTVEQETKKRIGHRGRSNCILKQNKNKS